MASSSTTNSTMSTSFTSFTITQPFLGAPLNFQPALGSKALDTLIDAFVTGTATKQAKLSQVTIDFYNHAQVDLSTGALVRTYQVAVSPQMAGQAYEQSPATSNSSGSSPTSSVTFGDSGITLGGTPMARKHASRVSKKPRKETKKSAEIRLPGFSIMTKDGIDVTSSAGRGTKTKEQREHAHLMRIMKACDACKKKKIRCDPSHRRSHTDMSRTSSTSASSARNAPSPVTSLPPLSRQTTQASSQESLPSFGSTMDDFVLFPEDASAWEAADMSLPEFNNCDLSQFNFDITDMGLNDFSNVVDQSFPVNGFEQQSTFQSNYLPVLDDQYGLHPWESSFGGSQPEPHSRPHQIGGESDHSQLDSSWYSSGSENMGSFSNSPISPQTTPAQSDWSNDLSQPQVLRDNFVVDASTTSPNGMNWSAFDLGSFSDVSQSDDNRSSALAGVNRKERRTKKRGHLEDVRELVDSVPSLDANGSRLVSPSQLQKSAQSGTGKIVSRTLTNSLEDLSSVQSTYTLLNASLEAFRNVPSGSESLSSELHQLRDTLEKVTSHSVALIQTEPTISLLRTVNRDLQSLSAGVETTPIAPDRPNHQKYNGLEREAHQEHLQEVALNMRRLVRSICDTIPNLQTPAIAASISTNNSPLLTSGASLNTRVASYETRSRCLSTASTDLEDCTGYDGGSSGYSTEVSSPDISMETGSGGSRGANTLLDLRAPCANFVPAFSQHIVSQEGNDVPNEGFRHVSGSQNLASANIPSLTNPQARPRPPPPSVPEIVNLDQSRGQPPADSSDVSSYISTSSPASPVSSDGTISEHTSPSRSFATPSSLARASMPSLQEPSLHDRRQLLTNTTQTTPPIPQSVATDHRSRLPTMALFPLPTYAANIPTSLPPRGEVYAWGTTQQTCTSPVPTSSLVEVLSSLPTSKLDQSILGFSLLLLGLYICNIQALVAINLPSTSTYPMVSLILLALTMACTDSGYLSYQEKIAKDPFVIVSERFFPRAVVAQSGFSRGCLDKTPSSSSSPSVARMSSSLKSSASQPWSKTLDKLADGVRGLRVL